MDKRPIKKSEEMYCFEVLDFVILGFQVKLGRSSWKSFNNVVTGNVSSLKQKRERRSEFDPRKCKFDLTLTPRVLCNWSKSMTF
jgi:hypothetical protein